MSELNQQVAQTLRNSMELLSEAQLTLTGKEVMPVAGVLNELQALYSAISENLLLITSAEQEAGPDPKESEDVAAN